MINALAVRLTGEFGRGYARSSLEYMRKFFLVYQERLEISQSLIGKLAPTGKSQSVIGKLKAAGQNQSLIAKSAAAPIFLSPPGESAPLRPFCLSWTHYIFLLSIQNPDERSFYEIESAAQDWTVRELKRQFDTSLYERLALSRDKQGIRKLAREGQIIASPSFRDSEFTRIATEVVTTIGTWCFERTAALPCILVSS